MADARTRVVVAMSGGVDSSVAAALLVDAGHDVVGVSMQLYDAARGEERFGSCCTIDDLHDARRVAHALGIPHYIVNLERRFDEVVVADFVREYASRTHAHPLRALQQRAQVLDAGGPGPRLRCRLRGDRPLRPGDARRPRRVSSSSRRRRRQGPGVLPLRADAGAARPRHVPAGRHAEGRGAAHRPRARPARGGQAGQPGDLLRPRRRLRGGRGPGTPGRPIGPHRRPATVASSGSTTACITSPSASGRASGLRPLDRCTW